MPKIKITYMEEKRRSVRAYIAKHMELNGYTDDDIAKVLLMTKSTFQKRKQQPETFKLEELWRLMRVLKIPDEEKHYFL